MFEGVQQRMALSYAAVVALTLLLLGPALYLLFTRQMADASDATLRLAAQRQAALIQSSTDISFGLNPHLTLPAALIERDTFYVLFDAHGRVRENPTHVTPDLATVRQVLRQRYSLFSTTTVNAVGTVRLYTVPVLQGKQIVAVLQAGHSLLPLAEAQRDLLYLLFALGAAAILISAIGGLWLTRQAMRPINAAFAAQRAFVAEASHELRTPLTLMRTNAEVLLEADAVPDPDDRALVEDIVVEADHMSRLIGDLLTLARLEAGALKLEIVPVHLDTLLDSCCRQMARLAERQGIHLTYRGGTSITVRADEHRLEQVVLILLDNAVKYNRERGTVEVTLRREGNQAMIDVCDSGQGIPSDELPRIFARFHRGPLAAARTEGSGLGLSIAAALIQAQQGRITVRSEPGVGSTFTIALPLYRRERGAGALSYRAADHDSDVEPPPDPVV